MIAELSKVYEVGRGAKEFQGNQYESGEKDNLSSTPTENVLSKTAQAVGVNEKTVQRARAYEKIIKEKQEMKQVNSKP